MAARDEIISFCDELLDAGSFDDYCVNGIQVPGAAEVTKVVSAVSANLELLERAVGAGAQLVLAHHGLFWGSGMRALSPALAARLRVSLGADLTVAGYHLPLDAHPEIGNNVLLCQALGFEPEAGAFAWHGGRAIGVVGRGEGIPFGELAQSLEAATSREPLAFEFGPSPVRSIGIVTGGGSSDVAEAASLGLDAFVTGEPSEPAMADAKEGGIGFLAGGHYATETFGIRRLGEMVAERFGVEHEFIDVPNPI